MRPFGCFVLKYGTAFVLIVVVFVTILLQLLNVLLNEFYQFSVGRFSTFNVIHLLNVIDILKILVVIDKSFVVAVDVGDGKDSGCRIAPDGWCTDGSKCSQPGTI